MQKKRDPKQELIDRQAQEIGRLRASVQQFVEVTDGQGQRIVALEREQEFVRRLREAVGIFSDDDAITIGALRELACDVGMSLVAERKEPATHDG